MSMELALLDVMPDFGETYVNSHVGVVILEMSVLRNAMTHVPGVIISMVCVTQDVYLVGRETSAMMAVTVVHTAMIAKTYAETVLMKAIALILMEHASLDVMLVMWDTCVKHLAT